jgi:hypothetical protein
MRCHRIPTGPSRACFSCMDSSCTNDPCMLHGEAPQWQKLGVPPACRRRRSSRSCGDGRHSVVFGRQPKSTDGRLPLRGGWGRRKRTEAATQARRSTENSPAVRRTTENSPAIHRWAIGATHRMSPIRDERGAVGTRRLCAVTVFRPPRHTPVSPAWIVRARTIRASCMEKRHSRRSHAYHPPASVANPRGRARTVGIR